MAMLCVFVPRPESGSAGTVPSATSSLVLVGGGAWRQTWRLLGSAGVLRPGAGGVSSMGPAPTPPWRQHVRRMCQAE